MSGLPETINTIGFLHVKTIQDKNLYFVYDWANTTVNDFMLQFENNYKIDKKSNEWAVELLFGNIDLLKLDRKTKLCDSGIKSQYTLFLTKYNLKSKKMLKNKSYIAYRKDLRNRMSDNEKFLYNISIKSMRKKPINISVFPEMTIYDLKLLLSDICHMSEEQQRLVYNNVILEDKKQLLDYNIQKNASLAISKRIRSDFNETNGSFGELKDSIIYVGVDKQSVTPNYDLKQASQVMTLVH
jgi:hypothetical protein